MRALQWVVVLSLAVATASAARVEAVQESEENPARGETLYQRNCAMCHARDASGMMGLHPALGGVVDRLT